MAREGENLGEGETCERPSQIFKVKDFVALSSLSLMNNKSNQGLNSAFRFVRQAF